jgi:serine/threonine protein kinase
LEFRSKNLIQCYGHYEGKYHSVLIFEFCERGDLLDKVNANGGFSEDEVRFMALQLVEGLVLLHANGIAHRDVKLDNVFEDGQGQLKIGKITLLTSSSLCIPERVVKGTLALRQHTRPEMRSTAHVARLHMQHPSF